MLGTTIVDGLLVFFGILLGAVPFVLLGILISAFLHVFIKDAWLLKVIPKNPVGATATLMAFAFLFPVCECGNVPVARRLIRKGIPPFAVIGFLLAAPVVNPIVILTTWVAFPLNPEVTVWRVVLTLAISMLLAMLFYTQKDQQALIVTKEEHGHCGHQHHGSKWRHFVTTVGEEINEMMRVLFWGSMIASFSQLLLPRTWVAAVGKGPLLSIVAMTALGFILSICSNVDAFLALSYSATFSTGSLLAFMVFGPMIDIKLLVMFSTIFTRKTIFWMSSITLLATIAGTLALNLFVL